VSIKRAVIDAPKTKGLKNANFTKSICVEFMAHRVGKNVLSGLKSVEINVSFEKSQKHP
jgi:hypothetical protein